MRLPVLVLILLFLFTFANAATIHLTNGQSIEGKIIEKNSGSVKVDVEGVGAMTYYPDEIKDIDGTPFLSPAPAQPKTQPQKQPQEQPQAQVQDQTQVQPKEQPQADPYHQLFKEATDAFVKGNYALSEQKTQAAIAISPKGEAYYNLAIAQYDEGKHEEAAANYYKAVDLGVAPDPDVEKAMRPYKDIGKATLQTTPPADQQPNPSESSALSQSNEQKEELPQKSTAGQGFWDNPVYLVLAVLAGFGLIAALIMVFVPETKEEKVTLNVPPMEMPKISGPLPAGTLAMTEKKWPILAQILIAGGCIGSLEGMGRLLLSKDIISGIMGVAGIVIWWNLYKLKPWALSALTVLYVISMLLIIISIFQGLPVYIGIIGLIIQGFLIWYFNSPPLKALLK